MNDVADTQEVPTEQFIKHVLPLCCEGDVTWHTNDEVREQIDWNDLADPSNAVDVEVSKQRAIIHSELQRSVSEKVARKTHWQPAEYTNHDVTVRVAFVLEWPTDADQYALPETETMIEQVDHPLEPPQPDVHAHKYDL